MINPEFRTIENVLGINKKIYCNNSWQVIITSWEAITTKEIQNLTKSMDDWDISVIHMQGFYVEKFMPGVFFLFIFDSISAPYKLSSLLYMKLLLYLISVLLFEYFMQMSFMVYFWFFFRCLLMISSIDNEFRISDDITTKISKTNE